jgi:hypothetical protein
MPTLGLSWENGLNTRILLKKLKDKNRVMEVVFSNYLCQGETEFTISDQGLSIGPDLD